MAELALGIVGIAGTVDVCIKFGKVLVQAYKDYGQADAVIGELSVRIQICWLRLLEAATLAISKSEKYASSKRVKAIQFLGLRETLESTVAELESWQKRFEPTWFQMIKSGPPDLDRALKKASQTEVQDRAEPVREGLKLRQAFNTSGSVKLAEKVLQELEWKAIPYCKAELAIRKVEKYFVVENVSRETVGWRDARELASRLRHSSPFTFGMLKCKGVVQSSTDSSLKICLWGPRRLLKGTELQTASPFWQCP
ncbi:hypothetical protein Focb16_v003328 [Fusarium oxysporum f. sp. cubense]|uniref:Uncharacterized protein n=1 Tax=Fusarium oxysporum f. sp. cubense TaxID=61366 RepID=A0A559KK45_FUSOC|nr:hypothetical protein Focb16_v003328 [Fusarium oxysporum f. sp. cubense]